MEDRHRLHFAACRNNDNDIMKIEEAITYAIMSDGHGRTLCCSGLCCDLPISLERLSHKGTIGRAVHQRRG